MTMTIKGGILAVLAGLAGLFSAMLPVAYAQEAAPFNRPAAIQQIVSAWGSAAGPAEQFQATLNAAADGALAQLLSATSMQQVRSILLGNLASQASGSGVMALGDSSQDLTFTPNNPPCRVFDTRNIGAGTAPAAATTSSYQVYGNAATITAQGGNLAGCAAPKGEPVAVSANFTAVPVGLQGHIRVFPFGGSLPTVSFVNFNGVVGNNIANSGIVSTCYLCAFDLSVYNGSQTHHIGDVMGYFYPATFGNIDLPNSTALTGNILKNGNRFVHNYGLNNTFIGVGAGNFTMSGGFNTASGTSALFSNTTGFWNTASGPFALYSNTTGYQNIAIGVQALYGNTSGAANTAFGVNALLNNTTGGSNIASGDSALASNTTGDSNAAAGMSALYSNTTGAGNAATGKSALYSNTTGFYNTGSGLGALYFNTTGQFNIGIGYSAGYLQTTGIANMYLGNEGINGESNTIRIGTSSGVLGYTNNRFFAVGIRGVTTGVANAVAVLIDSDGQLGTASSSRRVKQDIADMENSSSVLMDLRPVTFRYTAHGDDPAVQYGLIAEEVAEVAPGLVARSENGEAETVYYQHLAPMLVNEYQKQQRTIQAQAVEMATQKAEIAELRQQAAHMAEVLERLGRMDLTAGR